MTAEMTGWQFWVDRGGTFTDVVACTPQGHLKTLKLLSENPGQYQDAAVYGIQKFLSASKSHVREVDSVKMGTTVATNALLQHRGEPTLLVITEGFRDALRIGYQERPDIFALDIRLPQMLYKEVAEVKERISAKGEIIRSLDEEALQNSLIAALDRGINSVAIILLHGYRFPQHEKRAATLARQLGFKQVSVSHETSPLMKLITRADTTLMDAYLSPVLDRYVSDVRSGLNKILETSPLMFFMQSHGGLARADHLRGKDSVLSGPAGGVVGMVQTATSAGFEKLIGFDMGGTSTDVSLFEGHYERTDSALIGGVRVTAPMMQIHSIAAGGGSILKYESSRLQVGPESAGAFPGPACYRNSGPITVTDANVYLGRIQGEFFPKTFGENSNQPIDTGVVKKRFSTLAKEVEKSTKRKVSPHDIANGFLRIAIEKMSNAIKKISIQRGHDVTEFTLCCFGGAGGQHACQVADALGISKIFIHPLAGVMSAYGIGLADLRVVKQRACEKPLNPDYVQKLGADFSDLTRQAENELREQGIEDELIRFEQRLRLKIAGSDAALTIPWSKTNSLDEIKKCFHKKHEQHFGFQAQNTTIILESIESEAIGEMANAEEKSLPESNVSLNPIDYRTVWFQDHKKKTPVYQREELPSRVFIPAPAVIVEKNATTVIDPGWQGEVNEFGHLIISRVINREEREKVSTSVDPIMLEVFNNLFMHVAEQMGVVLEHTAHSVNIKERLDFSCALFDPEGGLIANAPHIPVHLGSMGESVKTILDQNRTTMTPGDVYVLNAPYNGGTHLPDITVITPVFDETGNKLEFTVACRAHHADVGGKTPGSMPATSKTIDEEGILLDNMVLVRNEVFLEEEIRAALCAGPYPARNPDQNIADLKAQVAANTKGVAELNNIVDRFGREVVHAYMEHIKTNAEECVKKAISKLVDGSWSVELDNGEQIKVSVRVDTKLGRAIIDFNGTSPVSQSNFNAPAAVVRAVVLYVFRTLVEENIPLNDGCFRPLTIRLPESSLVNPSYPAPVVAGNVETSQCITDALLAALGACAASQGTMNNFTFGNDQHQYYETICGGAGAGPDFCGASAVHTHMTNCRLTDPEVLEWRYPIRVERFEIRPGTGGIGAKCGGNGVVREIRFLEPMQAAILSNRRRIKPFGLAGGGDGQSGRNYIIRKSNDKTEEIGATEEVELAIGDRFVIETPGGGGYGKPN